MAATPAAENPWLLKYNAWRERTPVVCRAMVFSLVSAYLASWVLDATWALACVPFYTVYRIEMYRLVTSPLVGNSLLSGIFACLVLGEQVGPKLERSLGSVRFAVLCATAVLASNVAFVLACHLLAAAGAVHAVFFQAAGAWALVLALITIECLAAPTPRRRLFFLPLEMPKAYYPLALLALFSLFSGPQLDLALGLGFGYAFHHGYCARITPGASRLARWEQGAWLSRLVARDGFVPERTALGGAAWVPLAEDADWAAPATATAAPPASSNRIASVFDKLRGAPSGAKSAESPRNRFPDVGGRVLGTDAAPASTAAAHVAPSNAPASREDQEQQRRQRLARFEV